MKKKKKPYISGPFKEDLIFLLTFQEIISSSPFYNCEIVGGWKGKERHFTIVKEEADPIEKPTLLLLPKSADTLFQLPEYLFSQHIQGIILYGHEDIYLTKDILDCINDNNKPVLSLKEANLNKIKRKLDDLKQLKALGLYSYVWEQSSHYWLQIMNNHGLDGLLKRLRLLIDDDILLLDKHFYIYGENQKDSHNKQTQAIRFAFYQQTENKKESLSIVKINDDNCFFFSLYAGEELYGYIFLREQPGMMIDICIEQITYALPAILAYLVKEKEILQAHQSYKEQFLYNLLYNNLESEHGLMVQGKRWGWDFTKPTQLMVMTLEPINDTSKYDIDLEVVLKEIRVVVARNFLKAITTQIQSTIVIIVFDSYDNTPKERKEQMIALANQIYQDIQQAHQNVSCEIGLGRYYPSNMELFRSFYEAKIALELGKYELTQHAVRHFEDIGIARLLSNVHNDILHNYFDEKLGELLLLDEEHDDFYIETLESFYIHNRDINKTADHLFIHPNTLRKRIKKIESILNVEFDQLEDLFNIFVALKIMKMLKLK